MKVPNFLGYFNLLKQFSKSYYLLVKKSGITNLILIAVLWTRLPILNGEFPLLNRYATEIDNFLLTSLFIIDFHAVNFPQKGAWYLVIYLPLVHYINECHCKKEMRMGNGILQKKTKREVEEVLTQLPPPSPWNFLSF